MVRFKEVTDFDSFELNPEHMLEGSLLELLVDTKAGKVYHVEPPMDHIVAAAMFLGFKPGEVNKVNKANAGHLVSAFVEIKNGVVTMVMIGRSSLEMYYSSMHGHKRMHTPEQLAKARVIIERLISLSKQLGEVHVIDNLSKHEVVFK
jgi:hypothetical protein